jgi:hypothetical protein
MTALPHARHAVDLENQVNLAMQTGRTSEM